MDAGGFDAAVYRGESEIDTVCHNPSQGLTAVDLGAGFGMHAIPLARRGYSVVAIDSSQKLLDVLQEHVETLPIQTVEKGSRYFCESLFWASQPKQAAKT